MKARCPRTAMLIGAVILAGAAVRVPPLVHDFWLDEVWSYVLVHNLVTTPVEIVTKLHSDNNHPLNSLALYWIGTAVKWPVYRAPAWISGVLSLPLSYLVVRRFGRRHALYAVALVAFSYPLVVYSTEARGYGPMLCFLLLAIESMARWLGTGNWAYGLVFWAAVPLGMFSHLTFLHGYLALFAYSASEIWRRHENAVDRLRDFLKCHAVPIVFLIAFYWSFVRFVQMGGSAPRSLSGTLMETIAMTLGGPDRGLAAVLYAVGFLVLLSLALQRLRMRSEGWHWLFACGIALVPLPLVALQLFLHRDSTPIFPRYFLTSVMLFLLLTGFFLGELHERGGRARLIGGGLMTLVLLGNGFQAARFAQTGRGRYLEALRFIVSESPADPISVASNSDFRTRLLVSFYERYLPNKRSIIYEPRRTTSIPRAADWYIVELLEPGKPTPQEIGTATQRFLLKRYFDFYGPSGCAWAVYRRSK